MLGLTMLRQDASFLQQFYSYNYTNLDHKQAQVSVVASRATRFFRNQRCEAGYVQVHQDTLYCRGQHDDENTQSLVLYPLDQQGLDQPLRVLRMYK